MDCKGRTGGLIVLWKSEIRVEIQNYSKYHINVVIQCTSDKQQWKFTGFYGHPDANKRGKAWSLLWCLYRVSTESWLCIRDFNEILSYEEKSSFSVRPVNQMLEFQHALDDCELMDLGFNGPKYT